MRRRALLLGLPALVARPAHAGDAEAPLLTLDVTALAEARRRLAAGDPTFSAARAALLDRAARALSAPLRSVTDKTMTPPSGRRNDYMSMGPYWWPNPATPSGLPYVRRDGQRNPQVAGEALDSDRMQAFCRDVFELTLAHHFGAPDSHAEKAAAALRHWFLAPATRMAPHLRYGQGIPGIVEGRAEGMIDTRNLWMTVDSALLLNARGALGDAELKDLRAWFAEFTQWMQASPIAHDEDAAKNNHGMFFDAQLVGNLLFIGDTQAAKSRLATLARRRIAPQIEPDGRMPLELARTRPFHYSVFNLEAITRLARYGRGQGVDLWHDARLRKAITWLQAAALSPDTWGHATAAEPRLEADKLLAVLAMTRWETKAEQPLLAQLARTRPADLDWLLWP